MDDFIYNCGRYHSNKINIVIHIIFVPIIMFTLFILGGIYWPSIELGFMQDLVPEGRIGIITWLLALGTTIAYLMADLKTAFIAILWIWPQLFAAQHMIAAHEDVFAIKINGEISRLADLALYLHVAAWIAQFIGHGLFEKRAPALLDNMLFALLAPFFITFEVMNNIFGYYEAKMPTIRARINKDIQQYHAK